MANVRKFLDLSIEHLPLGLRPLDEALTPPGVVFDEHREYGWWVWVPSDVDEHLKEYEPEPGDMTPLEDGRIPEELVTLWRFARAQGCDWILFDCDAEEDPELPIFDEEHPRA